MVSNTHVCSHTDIHVGLRINASFCNDVTNVTELTIKTYSIVIAKLFNTSQYQTISIEQNILKCSVSRLNVITHEVGPSANQCMVVVQTIVLTNHVISGLPVWSDKFAVKIWRIK